MKPKSNFTYFRAIIYGVLTELILILIQFVYLKNYAGNNPDAEFAFTSEFMANRGFYVFQIIGFFVYSIIVFVLIRKVEVKVLNKVLVLIMTGVLVELLFYLIVPADYQIAYFYSVLDKFVAGAFGAIVYFYTT